MQIKESEDYLSTRHNSSETAYTRLEEPVRSTDAHFFASMLQASRSTNSATAGPGASLLLTEASKHLSASRKGFSEVVRSSKNGLDLPALKTFPRELFSAQLTSQMLVKTLAKTTQSIDKICNLQ